MIAQMTGRELTAAIAEAQRRLGELNAELLATPRHTRVAESWYSRCAERQRLLRKLDALYDTRRRLEAASN